MTDSDDDLDHVLEVLLQDKSLLFSEKLQVIQSIKQAFAFVGIVVGLLINTAYGNDVREAHIAIPFVVLAVGSYVLANTHALSKVAHHLGQVDAELLRLLDSELPLWQAGEAGDMITWGLSHPSGRRLLPNPYYAVGLLVVFLGLSVVTVSTVEAFIFLRDEGGLWLGVVWLALTITTVSAMLITGLRLLWLRVELVRGSPA